MKYMNTNRNTHRFSSKKKKTNIINNSNNTNNNNNSNFHYQASKRNTNFTNIFKATTTILSRSPSYTYIAPRNKMLSHNNMQKTNSYSQKPVNNSNQAFTNQHNNQYKKSKNIKISNNSNKGNFKKQFHNNNNRQQQQQQSFYNAEMAANNLANMLHSELTINLTKNEPRMVLFNNNNTTYSQQQQNNNINPLMSRKFFQQVKQHQKGKKNFQNNQQLMAQSVGNSAPVMTRYVNRFKYIKPANTRNHAPYNTTQYIMHDYSRRRANDQECPNEQQQFSDDWDMALTTGTTGATESLNKIANNINNPVINTNALISLSTVNEQQQGEVSGSLGSSLGSCHLSEMNIRLEDGIEQLSSSLWDIAFSFNSLSLAVSIAKKK